jgi:hypothetical protein
VTHTGFMKLAFLEEMEGEEEEDEEEEKKHK